MYLWQFYCLRSFLAGCYTLHKFEKTEIAALPNGAWMLRDAADALGLEQEVVDSLLKNRNRLLLRHKPLYQKVDDVPNQDEDEQLNDC